MTYDYSKLNLGKLDYEGIKSSLVSFLKSYPQFENFDFDNNASALNLFLDILCTNTAYNGYYLHSALTNAFPNTAKSKRSLILNAALHGTFIEDVISSRTVATLKNSGVSALPAFSTFTATRTNGTPCFFYNLTSVPVTNGANTTSVELVAGKKVVQFSNFDYNAKVMEIPTIYDAGSLTLQVQEEVTSGVFEFVSWTKIDKFSNYDIEQLNGKVYSVINGPNSYYVTTNIPGAATPSGAVKVVAIEAAGAITDAATVTGCRDSTNITVVSHTTPYGGRDSVSRDYVKSYTAYSSNSFNRIVTENDYVEAIYAFLISKGVTTPKTEIKISSPSAGVIRIFVPELSPELQTELLTLYLASKKLAGIVIEFGKIE